MPSCPSCGSSMKRILITREYAINKDMFGSSGKFLALYQCPSCKTIDTDYIDTDDEVWRKKYNDILKEYGAELE